MKKFFLSLMLLAISMGALFAQNSTIATLNHDGEISVFYGGDALKEAHAEAQHGDAITLSSGTFKAVDITKAITLRGAGMEVDSVRNTFPTIIQGDMNIQIGDSVKEKLTIEGIFHNSYLYVKGGFDNAMFIKSRFNVVSYAQGIQFKNHRFIQCKIGSEINVLSANLYFINCFINHLSNIVKRDFLGIFTNCIIRNNNFSSFYNSTLNNCILIGNVIAGNYNILPSSNHAYNCIGINRYNGFSIFTNIPNNTNKTVGKEYENVFKTYKGTYTDTETFELIDSIKTKYLGNDGTEVGIHGGMLPYSPTPTNPQITKCKVAPRSTADGKLSVDIEVRSAE